MNNLEELGLVVVPTRFKERLDLFVDINGMFCVFMGYDKFVYTDNLDVVVRKKFAEQAKKSAEHAFDFMLKRSKQ